MWRKRDRGNDVVVETRKKKKTQNTCTPDVGDNEEETV